ncbi:MAG: SDR family NAD(P)-dependent oxidoreductase [Pseudomonadota bacterium]
MTGGTAGFGAEAVRMVTSAGLPNLALGARTPDTVPREIADRVSVEPLDLARFSSVNAFCKTVLERGPFRGLVCNAGLNSRQPKTTEDGFDLTFQANFLSHFLILQRLWDHLTPDAHILITSSGTHDPEEKTPPPPPKHADVKRLAHPQGDPELDRSKSRAAARAYTASKLCCTALSLELARRRPEGLSVSFDPGLVPGTSLTREFPQWLVKLLLPIMSRTMPADRTSTLPASATALAHFMAQSSLVGSNGDYVAMRGGHPVVVPPSQMAREPDVQRKVWDDSLALISDQL